MKRFSLYLIAPFLALECQLAKAMAAEKSDTKPTQSPFHFDAENPAVKRELDRIDGKLVRCALKAPTIGEIASSDCKFHHFLDLTILADATENGVVVSNNETARFKALRSTQEQTALETADKEYTKSGHTVRDLEEYQRKIDAAEARIAAMKKPVFHAYADCVTKAALDDRPTHSFAETLAKCRARLTERVNMYGLGLNQTIDKR